MGRSKAELQSFLDQSRQAGPLPSGQRFGIGKQGIVDVESGLHIINDTDFCILRQWNIFGLRIPTRFKDPARQSMSRWYDLFTPIILASHQGQRRVAEEDQLVVSKPIIDELLGKLGRKFARDAEELAHVAVFLSELAATVRPRQTLHVVKDDPDNRILKCALAGHAQAIVTGDKALLALKEYAGVRMVSLREYPEDAAHHPT